MFWFQILLLHLSQTFLILDSWKSNETKRRNKFNFLLWSSRSLSSVHFHSSLSQFDSFEQNRQRKKTISWRLRLDKSLNYSLTSPPGTSALLNSLICFLFLLLQHFFFTPALCSSFYPVSCFLSCFLTFFYSPSIRSLLPSVISSLFVSSRLVFLLSPPLNSFFFPFHFVLDPFIFSSFSLPVLSAFFLIISSSCSLSLSPLVHLIVDEWINKRMSVYFAKLDSFVDRPQRSNKFINLTYTLKKKIKKKKTEGLIKFFFSF